LDELGGDTTHVTKSEFNYIKFKQN